jgi:hypothetical protein
MLSRHQPMLSSSPFSLRPFFSIFSNFYSQLPCKFNHPNFLIKPIFNNHKVMLNNLHASCSVLLTKQVSIFSFLCAVTLCKFEFFCIKLCKK